MVVYITSLAVCAYVFVICAHRHMRKARCGLAGMIGSGAAGVFTVIAGMYWLLPNDAPFMETSACVLVTLVTTAASAGFGEFMAKGGISKWL